MNFIIELEQETDGRWIAEIHNLPGVMVFAFHEKDEIGPKMLAKIAKHSGLKPTDL